MLSYRQGYTRLVGCICYRDTDHCQWQLNKPARWQVWESQNPFNLERCPHSASGAYLLLLGRLTLKYRKYRWLSRADHLPVTIAKAAPEESGEGPDQPITRLLSNLA